MTEATQQQQATLVTKDMTIGDVIRKYPAAIEPLQDAGVHCVGCHVSYYETLEQGFKGHGMSDEEVDAVITSINKAIAEYGDMAEKDLIVTKKAAAKLLQILRPRAGRRHQGGRQGHRGERRQDNHFRRAHGIPEGQQDRFRRDPARRRIQDIQSQCPVKLRLRAVVPLGAVVCFLVLPRESSKTDIFI